MTRDLRPLAVALGGFCSFLNLYAPQALLPELGREFGVGVADISAVMTVGTLGVALSAPFSGTVADVLGRKWIITLSMTIAAVPGILVTLAPDVHTIIAYRFVQGLLLPPIFTVVLAYVGDEWPPKEAAGIAGIYVTGASCGAFCGRLIPGVVADIAGWRAGFAALAVMTLMAAAIVAVALPREKNFVGSDGLIASARQMMRHFTDPRLVATFVVGFGILFNFIAIFTYVAFRLAAPPYSLSNSALGMLFATTLVGSVLSPLVGRGIASLGLRGFMLALLAISSGGVLLLLAPQVPIIIAGLVVFAGCSLLSQAMSMGFVATTATEGRSSAVGLYVTWFYVGGSLGAFLPGLTWDRLGWPVVVAEVLVMLAIMAITVALMWPPARPKD
jgi:MFS transporter, YNFM family, putative membrane transport protein